jgi:hypothetical protein
VDLPQLWLRPGKLIPMTILAAELFCCGHRTPVFGPNTLPPDEARCAPTAHLLFVVSSTTIRST